MPHHLLTRHPKQRAQRGASLIEVLVAVLILSFGMLGMSALQVRALQGNQSALQRSQATMLNYYILDAMRVDDQAARAGDYNTNNNFVCGSSGIIGTSLAKDNLRHWLDNAEANLGQAAAGTVCGFVACDGSARCTVRIRWDDTNAQGDPSGGSLTSQVELVSIL
jgi:type IV pilus assembly protein PilV